MTLREQRPVKVALVGASGFVGHAALSALEGAGHVVLQVPAPRLSTKGRNVDSLIEALDETGCREFGERWFSDVDVVVNAAGLSTATSGDLDALVGANAQLPVFLVEATKGTRVSRLVHVSSAAVQGRLPLDESETMRPASPYAFSKALGETALRQVDLVEVVRYRPGSVHGKNRSVTLKLVKFAESPIACVAKPGTVSSPVTSVERVGEAIALLTDTEEAVPRIVGHANESISTRDVLMGLGGKSPRVLSRRMARALLNGSYAGGSMYSPLVGHARRLEVLLLGQEIRESFLDGRLASDFSGTQWLKALRTSIVDQRVTT